MGFQGYVKIPVQSTYYNICMETMVLCSCSHNGYGRSSIEGNGYTGDQQITRRLFVIGLEIMVKPVELCFCIRSMVLVCAYI